MAASKATRPPSLGKLELRILQILWREKGATARVITDALNAEPGAKFVAHSTVQTLLRKLEAKNAVRHESDGRIFTFHATIAEGAVTEDATRDLLSRVFDGSVYGLVAHLLRHEPISAEERARLRELIDRAGNASEKGEGQE